MTALRQGPLSTDMATVPTRSVGSIDRDAAARATADLLVALGLDPETVGLAVPAVPAVPSGW